MPATSPEALARKADKRKQKRRAKTAVVRLELKKSDLPRYKIAARQMLPRLPEMSKAELREMLAQACRNTAAVPETADA